MYDEDDEGDDTACGCAWCKANPEPPAFPVGPWDKWLEDMVKAHHVPEGMDS